MIDTLQAWKLKIQEKRRQTPWREFVKEIVSWRPMVFHKWDDMITKYPQTDRIMGVQVSKEFDIERDSLMQYGMDYDAQQSFFAQFQELYQSFPQEAMLSMGNCQNVSYADVVFDSQNVYMSYFIVHECEDVLYTLVAREHCKRVFNSVMVFK